MTDRKPRADALRNRARVLEAAETVFAAQGPGASTEEIARQAGVGAGTLFRHFPTKEALLEAIVVSRLESLVQQASALATEEDAGRAFFAFFERMVDYAAKKKAFTEVLARAGVDVKSVVEPVYRDLRGALRTLLVRAQKVGAVRRDVRVPEVMALMVGAARVAEHAAGDRALQVRTLAVLCDGLRPQGVQTPGGAAK
jgi:AcrR family transcriptional regulator